MYSANCNAGTYTCIVYIIVSCSYNCKLQCRACVRLLSGGMQAVGQEWFAQAQMWGAGTLPASPPGLERLLTRPTPPMSYLLQPPRSVPPRLLTPSLGALTQNLFSSMRNLQPRVRWLMLALSLKRLFSRLDLIIMNNYNGYYVIA